MSESPAELLEKTINKTNGTQLQAGPSYTWIAQNNHKRTIIQLAFDMQNTNRNRLC